MRSVPEPVGPCRVPDVQALAAAVLMPGRRVRLLELDVAGCKRATRYAPLADAVRTGRSFMGDTQPTILALDADTDAQVLALDDLADELRAGGDRPVLVDSGRGRHLFCRLPRGKVARWAMRARAAGVDARHRSPIRPPLAPHPAGLPVALVNLTPAEALAALEPRRDHAGRLSPRMAALLVEGDTAGRYPSGSEAVQAVATGAVNAAWSFDRLADELARSPLAEVVARHGGRDWLQLSWRNALRFVDEHPSTATDTVVAARQAAEWYPWRGQGGRTDLAVLRAHLDAADAAGGSVHIVTRDAVATLTAAAERTVTRSHARLVAAGWLHRLDEGAGKMAAVWRVAVPEAARELSPPLPHTPGSTEGRGDSSRGVVIDRGHDAFRWGALGKVGVEVLTVLAVAEGPLSAAGIARRCQTAPHPATVARALARARTAGLVVPSSTGWLLVDTSPDRLDVVATTYGTAGKRAAGQEVAQRAREVRQLARAAWVAEELRQGRRQPPEVFYADRMAA